MPSAGGTYPARSALNRALRRRRHGTKWNKMERIGVPHACSATWHTNAIVPRGMGPSASSVWLPPAATPIRLEGFARDFVRRDFRDTSRRRRREPHIGSAMNPGSPGGYGRDLWLCGGAPRRRALSGPARGHPRGSTGAVGLLQGGAGVDFVRRRGSTGVSPSPDSTHSSIHQSLHVSRSRNSVPFRAIQCHFPPPAA